MKEYKKPNIPIVTIYKGYELDEILDTDDTGFSHGECIKQEEEKLEFEQDKD